MPRSQRPRFETMCQSCEQVTGVWTTPFNNYGASHQAMKVSRHYRPGGGWCPGSLLAIPEAAAIPTGAAA